MIDTGLVYDGLSEMWILCYSEASCMGIFILLFRALFDFIFFKKFKNKSVCCTDTVLFKYFKVSFVSLVASGISMCVYLLCYIMAVYILDFFQIFLTFSYLLCAASYVLYAVGIVGACRKKFKNVEPVNLFGLLSRSFDDKKSQRFFIVLWVLSVLSYTYMICFFGVTESYYVNVHEWHFVYSDLVIPMIVTFGIAALIAVGGSIACRWKWFKCFVLIAFVFVVASYFQNLFLYNSEFINGSVYFDIWLAFFQFFRTCVLLSAMLICIVLYSKYGTGFLKGASFVAGAVFVMQLVPTVSVLANSEDVDRNGERYVLTGENQFKVSENNNVVVFVLDSFSQRYMDVFSKDADVFSTNTVLKDFVDYSDVGANFCATCMAMPSILTGHDADMTMGTFDRNEWLWHTDSASCFYDTLHANDYKVNLYTDYVEYCGGGENMLGKVDNIELIDLEYEVDSFGLYGQMMKLSFYKYLPSFLRSYAWISESDEINKYAHEIHGYDYDGSNWDMMNANTDASKTICFNNYDFYNKLMNEKLSFLDNDDNMFSVIHLGGMHQPFVDLNGNPTFAKQVFSDCINMVDAYCRQLQDMGVYDDALIIITADHGEDPSHSTLFRADLSASHPTFMIKLPHASSDKLSVKACRGYLPTDFLPTVLDAMGLDYDESVFPGMSLLSMDESMPRTRYYYSLNYSDKYPDVPKCVGISKAIYNIYYTVPYDDISELVNAWSLDESKITMSPLVDDWW